MNRLLLVLIAIPPAIACGSSDDIDSDAEARLAYLGFDTAIDRSLNLGFDGFNSASSANISTQTGDGDETGTLAVDGQVDQGASDNKGMRLVVTLVDYSDGVVDDTETEDIELFDLHYDTADDSPLLLDLSLRDIPNGTFTGTMSGDATLSGDLDATATFALAFAGSIMESGSDVVRVPGTLTITGTVTSADGVFDVDISR